MGVLAVREHRTAPLIVAKKEICLHTTQHKFARCNSMILKVKHIFWYFFDQKLQLKNESYYNPLNIRIIFYSVSYC